jgi:hypothetical protein
MLLPIPAIQMSPLTNSNVDVLTLGLLMMPPSIRRTLGRRRPDYDEARGMISLRLELIVE